MPQPVVTRELRLEFFYAYRPFQTTFKEVQHFSKGDVVMPPGAIAYREISENTRGRSNEERDRKVSGIKWSRGARIEFDEARQFLGIDETSIHQAKQAGAAAFIMTDLPSNHHLMPDDEILNEIPYHVIRRELDSRR